ncbi:hypothetical protein IEO21_02462 [Rhodonia placenta]|uniref:Uncharacterized protein n=1 Tax=Rhodonia placenta TaxID=104341 RepID=A0A8H7P7M6_9APHY|nr:hypothetical protein IEO21_02462 [Postia placenta]
MIFSSGDGGVSGNTNLKITAQSLTQHFHQRAHISRQ